MMAPQLKIQVIEGMLRMMAPPTENPGNWRNDPDDGAPTENPSNWGNAPDDGTQLKIQVIEVMLRMVEPQLKIKVIEGMLRMVAPQLKKVPMITVAYLQLSIRLFCLTFSL